MVRAQPDPPIIYFGGLAQLGEHLLCKQGVVGSIPSSSTIFFVLEVRLKSVFVFLSLAFIASMFFNNLEEVRLEIIRL